MVDCTGSKEEQAGTTSGSPVEVRTSVKVCYSFVSSYVFICHSFCFLSFVQSAFASFIKSFYLHSSFFLVIIRCTQITRFNLSPMEVNIRCLQRNFILFNCRRRKKALALMLSSDHFHPLVSFWAAIFLLLFLSNCYPYCYIYTCGRLISHYFFVFLNGRSCLIF